MKNESVRGARDETPVPLVFEMARKKNEMMISANEVQS